MAARPPSVPTLTSLDGTARQIPSFAPVAVPPSSAFSSASSSSSSSTDTILFLHPGYGSSINVLFALPRVDGKPALGARGVHHRTALTTCQIVANNAFEGFLSLDAKGQRRVDETLGLDDILVGREYFFIVPGDARYPIVPAFHDWEFPHHRVPDFWPHVQQSEKPENVCSITRYPFGLTAAHLVPVSEKEWFNRNGMWRYGISRVPDIDDLNNILPLKADMHVCLDKFMYALVPKPCITADQLQTSQTPQALRGTGKTQECLEKEPQQEGHQQQEKEKGKEQLGYSIHVLANEQALFTSLYHDIQLSRLQGVAREYLFARFALAVFIGLKPFINSGYKRRIARLVVADDSTGPEVAIEEVSGLALQAQYGGGKSRSASPSKRKRQADEVVDQLDAELWEGFSTTHGISYDWPADVINTDEERGRPRKRMILPDHIGGCSGSRGDPALWSTEGDLLGDLPSLCSSASSFSSHP